MLAARLHREPQGPALHLDEVPVPEPRAGEVLLRVAGTGLCHSDLHLLDGSFSTAAAPVTLGHEIAGWVHHCGAGIDDLREDEVVAVLCVCGCGSCEWCLVGDHELCPRMVIAGSTADGGFAEYVLIRRRDRLIPLGDLDPVRAAPLTDAALTPYRAVLRVRDALTPGTSLVVLGVGGLGEYAVQLARLLTPAAVIAVDPRESRRRRALELGADATIDPRDPDVDRAILDDTGGRGAAAVIDLVGSTDTLRLAARVLAPRGIVALVGLAGGDFATRLIDFAPEATFTTVLSGGNARHLLEVVRLAQSGLIVGEVSEYPLGRIAAAIADLEAGRVEGRAVICPTPGTSAHPVLTEGGSYAP
jgi:alcohol dehydrogenase, propanol-preferring